MTSEFVGTGRAEKVIYKYTSQKKSLNRLIRCSHRIKELLSNLNSVWLRNKSGSGPLNIFPSFRQSCGCKFSFSLVLSWMCEFTRILIAHSSLPILSREEKGVLTTSFCHRALFKELWVLVQCTFYSHFFTSRGVLPQWCILMTSLHTVSRAEGFDHTIVNHQQNYVDPNIGEQTQSIERLRLNAKISTFMKKRGTSIPIYLLQSHLDH